MLPLVGGQTAALTDGSVTFFASVGVLFLNL